MSVRRDVTKGFGEKAGGIFVAEGQRTNKDTLKSRCVSLWVVKGLLEAPRGGQRNEWR